MAAGGGGASLLGSASTWPLKRYGRFLPPADGDEEQSASSWKVARFLNQMKNLVILSLLLLYLAISLFPKGEQYWYSAQHYYFKTTLMAAYQALVWQVYQKKLKLRTSKPAMLKCQEGFSLIDCHKWLKVVRRADCLLLCAKSKNECRMFRVQFGGDSKQQMLEHCCNCVQKLAEYVPVQVTDEQSQNLCHSGGSQVEDAEQVLHVPDEPQPDSYTSLGERRSLTQLAQSVLKQKFELPLVYRHSVWSAQELGPFIRLCLMDQNFPAFVEDVEKELKKLAEG